MEHKVGLIIASWNHVNFTKACIDSIAKYTDPGVPIVVIDNGSEKETLEYLHTISLLPGISVIYNEKNLGIAPVINQGIKWCLERDLDPCFISNDIIVGNKWLERLQEGIYAREDIGAGSPYLGPEATYDDFVNMEFRNNYRRNIWPKLKIDPTPEQLWDLVNELHGGDWDSFTETWAETRKDIPPLFEWFSMLMYFKKSTIEKVGLLDEQFVPSNWEDMDYMVRMNNCGLFRISVTGSYCFHWSNISNRNEFQDRPKEYSEEMSENEKRFHKKWRVFLPRELQNHGISDGDKWSPMARGPKCPFPVSDEIHSRSHDKWFLWNPEDFPSYFQLSREGVDLTAKYPRD